jgi:hypothetical protein
MESDRMTITINGQTGKVNLQAKLYDVPLVSSFPQADALSKLLSERRLTQQEFLAKISEERATYQAMFKPTPH